MKLRYRPMAGVLMLAAICMQYGCANYQVGDASKAYCLNTTPEGRTALRMLVASAYPGMSVVNYCAMFGVPLVLVSAAIHNDVDPVSAE